MTKEKMLAACKQVENFMATMFSLYGQNLQVLNWHLNGEAEPLDNFFDETGPENELDLLREVIAELENEVRQ